MNETTTSLNPPLKKRFKGKRDKKKQLLCQTRQTEVGAKEGDGAHKNDGTSTLNISPTNDVNQIQQPQRHPPHAGLKDPPELLISHSATNTPSNTHHINNCSSTDANSNLSTVQNRLSMAPNYPRVC